MSSLMNGSNMCNSMNAEGIEWTHHFCYVQWSDGVFILSHCDKSTTDQSRHEDMKLCSISSWHLIGCAVLKAWVQQSRQQEEIPFLIIDTVAHHSMKMQCDIFCSLIRIFQHHSRVETTLKPHGFFLRWFKNELSDCRQMNFRRMNIPDTVLVSEYSIKFRNKT